MGAHGPAQQYEEDHAAQVGAYDAGEFFEAGVFPYSVVEAEGVEEEDVAEYVYGHGHGQCGDVCLVGYSGACEAYGCGEPYGDAEGYDVCEEQYDGERVATHVGRLLLVNFCCEFYIG